MTASLSSAFPWARLRRSVGVTAAVFFAFAAAACGDDDDDGGTGPSADCLDEIDFSHTPFDADDVTVINVGGSRNASLSTSDLEDEGYYIDVYVIGVDNSGELTITANPSGFDLVMLLADENFEFLEIADDPEDPDATEQMTVSVSAGCYVLAVTSYEQGETGSYTLSVED